MDERRTGPTVRLDRIERDSRDHAKSITEIVNGHSGLAGRISVLEQANNHRTVLEARQEERAIARETWQKKVEKDLSDMRGGVNKLLWIVATGVIGAFLAFIINGGLVK